MCVCMKDIESVCVCVCVCMKDIEYAVCVCLVCVCVKDIEYASAQLPHHEQNMIHSQFLSGWQLV